MPQFAEAEPRLRMRYHQLMMAHLNPSQRVAAGLHPPPSLANGMSATQAAWRFYNNPNVKLTDLVGPLIECARADIPRDCDSRVLVPLDWANLHYHGHDSKADRVPLARSNDLGYELLTALAVSDRDGAPIAPLLMDLRANDGVHTTRTNQITPASSSLDNLTSVMTTVRDLDLGKSPVFIVDREADSVGHYRNWDATGFQFLVRARDRRLVLHEGQKCWLHDVADAICRNGAMQWCRSVECKQTQAEQYVAETEVVLHRPARQHRVDPASGNARHHNVAGVPLSLRLIVSEVRDDAGEVLSRWLLLTNLPASIDAGTIALWYYWRWRIESYHKLLKGAGQQVECWQQETAGAVVRRLLVAAMAAVVVWRLARLRGDDAKQMRDLLVRLSGRQMKRGKNARGFTEPALLAGLGTLITMMDCLQDYSPKQLRQMLNKTIPGLLNPQKNASRTGYDDG